jgi:transcriptional regulator with GAF, ATPase, and Fis domain
MTLASATSGGCSTTCWCYILSVAPVVDLAADLKSIAFLSTQPHRLARTLGNALHSLGQVIPYDLAVLYRLKGQSLIPTTAHGPLSSERIRSRELQLEDFPTLARALDHGRPVALRAEHHASEEGDPYDGVLDLPHGHACMVIPLRSGDAPVGLITLDRQVCGSYSPNEVAVADVYAQLVSVALAFAEQAELLDRYRQQLELQNLSLSTHALASSSSGSSPAEVLERTANPAMARVLGLAKQVAKTSLPVLIRGETGSGKELLARALHDGSERAGRPFVALNCAAVPEHLFESELFGHTRGAFSGAVKERPGRFVAANGGTLFLDEIGDLPIVTQAKLLRALQEGSFEPVGSDATIKVDVRVIAASHVDLEAAIRERRFREDLYFRLAAVPLTLPPLRERPEDLVPLAIAKLRQLETRQRGPWELAPDAVEHLRLHPWPGNVRELLHTIERATVLVPAGLLRAEHLSPTAFEAPRSTPPPAGATELTSFADAERRHLQRALERSRGKIYGPDGAAQLLGLKPTTLQAKLKKHGLKGLRRGAD